MSESVLSRVEFASIPGGTYELGWRFSGQLPDEAAEALEEFMPLDEALSRFSAHRTVDVPPFSLATTAVPLEELLGDPYEIEGVGTIQALCDRLDEALRPSGYRVPAEDEFEAACGGELFAWGMTIPDGIPSGSESTFQLHKQPNEHGLVLNSDPYFVEVVRHAFKLGDGGSAICGAYPWPIAWLSLSPSWFLIDPDVEDCFAEYLESACVRVVRSQ